MNRLLLLCDKQPNTAATVYDHIDAICKYSKFKVDALNPLQGPILTYDLIKSYDIIVIHYSIVIVLDSYLHPNDRFIISNFNGIKAVFIQDEYRWVSHTVKCLRAMKIDLLFTCVPTSEIEKVYSKKELPNLKCINTLTGFVPEYFYDDKIAQDLPGYDEREYDVVYRGRKLSAAYGSLAREKSDIVDKFRQQTKGMHIKYDLSYLEDDRVYGQDWLSFLKNSKATLGTESGASVFDFTGNILKQVQMHEKVDPLCSFEKLESLYFDGLDNKIKVNQISPRIFEAIALKTMLILYEGEYSGVVKPWQHFVPLKKDFSNIKDVVNFVNDKVKWQQMTDRAYNDVIKSAKYSFRNFVKKMDYDIFLTMGVECSSIGSNFEQNNSVGNNQEVLKNVNTLTISNIVRELYKTIVSIIFFILNIVKFFWRVYIAVISKINSIFYSIKRHLHYIFRRINIAKNIFSMSLTQKSIPKLYEVNGDKYVLCLNNKGCTYSNLKTRNLIVALPQLFNASNSKIKPCSLCKWYYMGYSLY